MGLLASGKRTLNSVTRHQASLCMRLVLRSSILHCSMIIQWLEWSDTTFSIANTTINTQIQWSRVGLFAGFFYRAEEAGCVWNILTPANRGESYTDTLETQRHRPRMLGMWISGVGDVWVAACLQFVTVMPALSCYEPYLLTYGMENSDLSCILHATTSCILGFTERNITVHWVRFKILSRTSHTYQV